MKNLFFALVLLVPGLSLAQVDAAQPSVDAAPAAVEAPPVVPETVESAISTGQEIIEQIGNGQVLLGIMLALILIVGVVRKLSKSVGFLKFFTTKTGGYLLTYGGSMAGAIVTAKQAGLAVDLKLLIAAVTAGFAASGGWEAFSDVAAWAAGKFGKGAKSEDKPEEEKPAE